MNWQSILSTLISVSLLCFGLPAYATESPQPLSTDNRIKVVPFEDNQVIPVHVSTFITTQIVFSKKEVIEDIQGGDKDAWWTSVDEAIPYMLFIKPLIARSDSNIIVVTNHHTYYFHMQSHQGTTQNDKKPSVNVTYAIHFTYPNEARRRVLAELRRQQQTQKATLSPALDPARVNWDYSFSGAGQIMPLHVFDNGTFTFFRLRPNQPIPAIFAVDNVKGEEAVVNYRRWGDYLVVQRLAPQFTLREGKYIVASVFNDDWVAQLTGRKPL